MTSTTEGSLPKESGPDRWLKWQGKKRVTRFVGGLILYMLAVLILGMSDSQLVLTVGLCILSALSFALGLAALCFKKSDDL